MEYKNSPKDATQTAAGASRLPVVDRNRIESDFTPSADEVARRAYFSYVNQGSRQGQDVQHWLAAEAELIEERNLTRAHGFHIHTSHKVQM